jgi:hypothetical protein
MFKDCSRKLTAQKSFPTLVTACGLILPMQFRSWLPKIQTAAMLLIVWSPWNPKAHHVDGVFANGTGISTWTLLPPEAIDWAQGVNLPAVVVVTPLEFATRKSGDLPNSKIRFYGVWLVGLLCWYMVGRFVDDLREWRRTRSLPRKHPADLTFALIATPSAALLEIAFNEADRPPQVLTLWGMVWLVITITALLFRVAQEIRQRRKPAIPRQIP